MMTDEGKSKLWFDYLQALTRDDRLTPFQVRTVFAVWRRAWNENHLVMYPTSGVTEDSDLYLRWWAKDTTLTLEIHRGNLDWFFAGDAAGGMEGSDEPVQELPDRFFELLQRFTRAEPEPAPATEPIPMLIWCPACGERHIDEGEFATKPHHTHACQGCGLTWRQALVPTVGVQYLPGFKNDIDSEVESHQHKQTRLLEDPERLLELQKTPLLALRELWKRALHREGMKCVRLYPMIGQLERALTKQGALWSVEPEVTVDRCVQDLGFKPCPTE